MAENKIVLAEKDMPDQWYNVLPDLPAPLPPPIHPGTGQPIGPDDLAPLFPMGLILQEVSQEPWIPIPDEVRTAYLRYRPTPMYRARFLEEALATPARIYYKYEGVSGPGSHKPNTAIAQAYYNKEEGVKRLTTETGAGQWGSALAFATCIFGLECTVYMVRVSYEQKPYRRSMMNVWGADVTPSPSEQTEAGRKVLADAPDSPGSLGIAISEAVEDAATHDDAKYSLGSVLNHVLLHQTIVGQETKKQFEMAGDFPDVIVGCVGGGSNFAGLFLPYMPDKASGKDMEFIAVEPTACPTLTRGPYRYDFGDAVGLTPLIKMYTLGHGFVPPPVHAGGLRYHGDAPILCLLRDQGIVEAVAVHQIPVFEAAVQFARTEGIIPAPETAHAVKVGIDKALEAKEEGKERTILIGFSGHGLIDMGAYDAYFAGKLVDYEFPQEEMDRAIAEVPEVAGP
ncbi:MAG: TrpB-like pyridoxal phosphate-dependent enzyme [Armatimonadota bacterium]